jgi:hypothetical protein
MTSFSKHCFSHQKQSSPASLNLAKRMRNEAIAGAVRAVGNECMPTTKHEASQRALASPEIDPSRFGNASSNTTARRQGLSLRFAQAW